MLLKLFVLLQGIRSELYQKHSEEIQLAKQPGNSYVQGLLRLGILTAQDSYVIKRFLDIEVLTLRLCKGCDL